MLIGLSQDSLEIGPHAERCNNNVKFIREKFLARSGNFARELIATLSLSFMV